MAVNVQTLFDLAQWTRSSEYKKGGYVALTEPLADYPLFNLLLTRETLKSTPTLRFQILKDADQSFEVTQVGEPIQVSIPRHAQTASMNWAKVRTSVSWFADEEAFNGAEGDQIIDVVAARKVEFDAAMRRALEVKFAGNASEPSKNDIIGLKDWLPAKTAATNLELNGGADVVYGLSGVTVANTPRWGHAVCGFTQLSDDDLFGKLSEFMHRSKYFVPEGARAIDPGTSRRCILVNSPTFVQWEKIQTSANDDLRDDVGVWRGAINFRSVPAKILHAQSEPDSAATPDGHALVYMLDLNTIKMFVHSDYNFVLDEPVKDPNIPGSVKMWRQAYLQLGIVNREKNLVARTTASPFVV